MVAIEEQAGGKAVDLQCCTLRQRPDGILELHSKIFDEITLEHLKEITKALPGLVTDPTLVLVFSNGASMSFEAMEQAAASNAARAVALVAADRVGAVISHNIVDVIDALRGATAMAAFDNEAEAVKWLLGFKD